MSGVPETFNYIGYGPEADVAFMHALVGGDRDALFKNAFPGSVALGCSIGVQLLEDVPNNPVKELGDISALQLLFSVWNKQDFVSPGLSTEEDDTLEPAACTFYEGLGRIQMGFAAEWNIHGAWKHTSKVLVEVPIMNDQGKIIDRRVEEAIVYHVAGQRLRPWSSAPKNRQHDHFPMGRNRTIQQAKDMHHDVINEALLSRFS